MTVQPFKKEELMNAMRYHSIFVSDTRNGVLEDRERYETSVIIDPWNKLIGFKCTCKGFTFAKGKKICKHISQENKLNPGLLQILKNWDEIQDIPEVENKQETEAN